MSWERIEGEVGEWSDVKTCPACGKRLPLTTEWWYRATVERTIPVGEDAEGHTLYERQKVTRAQSYCKACAKRKRRDAKRARRMIESLAEAERQRAEDERRGPCDCCGKQATDHRQRIEGWGIYCQPCYSMLASVGFDVEHARSVWTGLAMHLAEEAALDATWLSDRKRRAHLNNPSAPQQDHRLCTLNEQRWRTTLNYLERRRMG